ncbi:sodium- and chloride-dependent GABA transporter 1-like [Actinia tenebrosa]|uniref:Sodium- and chloride-dependent GABA transporter 1-like n=1 Tax=Actinia tenebrosa TaxID=6105 RepID=A0A6P8IDJ9_ACTTE|nr:sodium- and chloride-dependent GABA transporter 1-like [Actinia tenebrosa]
MLLLCGIPLFFMELAIGQYFNRGAVRSWTKMCPAFTGIGIAMLIISAFISIYYNVIIAWSFYYFVTSMKSEVPYKTCGNPWNSPLCLEPGRNATLLCMDLGLTNCTMQLTTPSVEYWRNFILQVTSGIEVPGEIRPPLALALFVAWVIVFSCVLYGIRSSGKVAYFSATFPYVLLAILIVRGATLPGAYDGIMFYLTPDFSILLNPQAWVDAASQIFFSLSCGLGGLIVFGSYNDFHNNCQKDAVFVSIINCFTSFFGGFATFTVIGFVAHTLEKDVKHVISSGPGLAFVVYPESIAQMPISPLWSVLFFFMLFLLGIDSQFVFIETIMSCLTDEFKLVKNHKKMTLAGLCCIFYLLGLSCVTQGGVYVFHIMDKQSGGLSLIFVSIFECIVIGWFYGVDRFSENIQEMLGKRPSLYFRLCWKYISPTVVTLIFLWSIIQYKGLTFEEYVYPVSGELFGWGLALLSMLSIPLYALWYIVRLPGSCATRIKTGFRSIESPVTWDVEQQWSQYQSTSVTGRFSRPTFKIPTFHHSIPSSSASVADVHSMNKEKIDVPNRCESTPMDLRKLAILRSMGLHLQISKV